MSAISQAVALRPDGDIVRMSVRTCDVLVQYRIFLDHIVNQAPRCSVEDQHFPLKSKVRIGEEDGGERGNERRLG